LHPLRMRYLASKVAYLFCWVAYGGGIVCS